MSHSRKDQIIQSFRERMIKDLGPNHESIERYAYNMALDGRFHGHEHKMPPPDFNEKVSKAFMLGVKAWNEKFPA